MFNEGVAVEQNIPVSVVLGTGDAACSRRRTLNTAGLRGRSPWLPVISPARTPEHTDIWRTGKITKWARGRISAGQMLYGWTRTSGHQHSTTPVHLTPRGEFAVEIGRGNSAVHEEVAASDERAVGPMRSAPTVPTSSGVPPRPAGDSSIMRRYPSPRGPVSSSLASGAKMMPGLIVLIRAPRGESRHGRW